LISGKSPLIKKTMRSRMFEWYDRTLLDVLLNNKLEGKAVFTAMFQKIPPNKILEFLNNESRFIDELKIMNSLPIIKFGTSGLKQLIAS